MPGIWVACESRCEPTLKRLDPLSRVRVRSVGGRVLRRTTTAKLLSNDAAKCLL
jgi:hypothetical protein